MLNSLIIGKHLRKGICLKFKHNVTVVSAKLFLAGQSPFSILLLLRSSISLVRSDGLWECGKTGGVGRWISFLPPN